MKNAFLIITYGDNYLENCIESIKRFYPDFTICIVDNNLESTYNLPEAISNLPDEAISFANKNLLYSKNEGNFFELGAIWFAVKRWPFIDRFIIIHNSMMLIDKLPLDIDTCDFYSFWKTWSADYSPVVGLITDKVPNFEYDKPWYSVTGCCCIIKTEILKELIKLGYDKIYATNKSEAVSTEILFGYLISNVMHIENKSIFEYPLERYVHNQIPYKYIKKVGSCQGVSMSTGSYDLNNYPMFEKIKDIRLTDPSDKNECYIDLIKVIDTDENIDIQNFLVSTGLAALENDKSDVLCSIRHRMFTKKYFPTFYKDEKDCILARTKKLFY